MIAGLGYLFGHALAAALKELYRYELAGFVIVAMAIIAVWVVLRIRANRARTRLQKN